MESGGRRLTLVARRPGRCASRRPALQSGGKRPAPAQEGS